MSLFDSRGVPVSTGDQAPIDALEAAHEQSLGFCGDAVSAIDEVLQEHPDFVMGHCFKAGMLTQTMETRIYDDMVASLNAAEALADKANDRERGHMAALRAWVEGDFHEAVERWQAVLVEYPRDLLALQLAHLSDVLLGDTVNQRDVVARVLPEWHEGIPGYGYVLGFYAFGLEECRDFSRAEELGRRAVAMNPKDAYAIHAVAHVMEMQGRQEGGIWWMTSREDDWARGNFANHLWWHLSLFHLDLGQIDRVLAIYDTKLRSRAATDEAAADKYEELDAAALLWRLELLGVDVGGRWSDLADKWERSAADTLYAFNDVHAMMAFVADGRDAAAETVLNATERYAAQANDANVAMTRIIGLPFCRALQAFARGDYDATVDQLLPIRYRTHRLGGSHAQRDIIAWTLMEAALRAGRHKLARALANERTALKPTSPTNWGFAARALQGLGDYRGAERARAKATALKAHWGA
ncbi:MAG: tetratricopeptide repeat protein [Rhodospirillales bacterium]|nr:tetratricopeptide repeat protein [Rhodospirillales bacterium]